MQQIHVATLSATIVFQKPGKLGSTQGDYDGYRLLVLSREWGREGAASHSTVSLA